MKATGIVRRIDDLGRVVIPKEIRRTLRIREGDPLEIFVDREGEVILKKYSPIGELGDFAQEIKEELIWKQTPELPRYSKECLKNISPISLFPLMREAIRSVQSSCSARKKEGSWGNWKKNWPARLPLFWPNKWNINNSLSGR